MKDGKMNRGGDCGRDGSEGADGMDGMHGLTPAQGRLVDFLDSDPEAKDALSESLAELVAKAASDAIDKCAEANAALMDRLDGETREKVGTEMAKMAAELIETRMRAETADGGAEDGGGSADGGDGGAEARRMVEDLARKTGLGLE